MTYAIVLLCAEDQRRQAEAHKAEQEQRLSDFLRQGMRQSSMPLP
jgi:hypothetical protein